MEPLLHRAPQINGVTFDQANYPRLPRCKPNHHRVGVVTFDGRLSCMTAL